MDTSKGDTKMTTNRWKLSIIISQENGKWNHDEASPHFYERKTASFDDVFSKGNCVATEGLDNNVAVENTVVDVHFWVCI